MPEDLRALLATLPPVEDPVYEFRATDLLSKAWGQRDALQELVDDVDDGLAFNALFVELAILSRNRDYAQYRDAVAAHRDRFGTQPRFLGFEALACTISTDEPTLLAGLNHARNALAALPGRPGILHTFGSLATSLADLGKASEQLLDEAERALREAISRDPTYAKYHATLARVLLHKDRYPEARIEIDRAIELEPSDGNHYALRIGDYQDIRMAISLSEQSDQLAKKQEDAAHALEAIRDEVKEQRGQAMALLGLLAAVVALIVTSVQITTHLRLSDAAGLLIVMASTIVAMFASFRILFIEEPAGSRSYVLLVLALLVMSGVWAIAHWT